MAKSTNTAFLMAGEQIEEDNLGSVISATRNYRVITSFASTGATALGATGMPVAGEAHPTYANLRVVGRSPVMQEDGITWIVTIKYEPANGTLTVGQPSKTTRLEYGTHAIQEDVLINIGNGLPLLDANQKPFEGTIQEAVEYPYIKLVKQQKSVRRSDVLSISGTINDADVTVAGVVVPKWCGRIKIVATETTDALYPWEISYEVMVRNHQLSNYLDFENNLKAGPTNIGWCVGVLNRGYYYYVSGGEMNRATENVLDHAGNVIERRPTATPVLLQSDGTLLPEGGTPLSILVQTIRSASWADLGLNDI